MRWDNWNHHLLAKAETGQSTIVAITLIGGKMDSYWSLLHHSNLLTRARWNTLENALIKLSMNMNLSFTQIDSLKTRLLNKQITHTLKNKSLERSYLKKNLSRKKNNLSILLYPSGNSNLPVNLRSRIISYNHRFYPLISFWWTTKKKLINLRNKTRTKRNRLVSQTVGPISLEECLILKIF